MDIQVTLTLANSSQTCSSSCIFKCLWAELFFQLHIVVLSPILCNCWTLFDVCEKSIFGCQSRALSCTGRANARGATPGWTVRAAAARAPLALNKTPSDQSTDNAPAAQGEGYNEPQQRLLQDTPSLSHEETQYSWIPCPRKGLRSATHHTLCCIMTNTN